MPVFKYKGFAGHGEEHVEEGTVVAKNEEEAREKLISLEYRDVHLKKMDGIAALLKKFSADVK